MSVMCLIVPSSLGLTSLDLKFAHLWDVSSSQSPSSPTVTSSFKLIFLTCKCSVYVFFFLKCAQLPVSPRTCRRRPTAARTFCSVSGTTARARCATPLGPRGTSRTAATAAARSPTAASWRACAAGRASPSPWRPSTTSAPVRRRWGSPLRQVRRWRSGTISHDAAWRLSDGGKTKQL